VKKGEKLAILGRGGVGGPAAMLSKKLMPEVDVTIVSKEERFIVRRALPHVVAGLATADSITNPDKMLWVRR
jgi:NADH oxidase (H2O2-forming)